MTKKNRAEKIPKITLKVLLTAALIFYFLFFVEELSVSSSGAGWNIVTITIMFVFFLMGYFFFMKGRKIAGILLIVWYGLLLLLSFLFWTDAGMAIVFGFPIFVFGLIIFIKDYLKQIKKLFLKK